MDRNPGPCLNPISYEKPDLIGPTPCQSNFKRKTSLFMLFLVPWWEFLCHLGNKNKEFVG